MVKIKCFIRFQFQIQFRFGAFGFVIGLVGVYFFFFFFFLLLLVLLLVLLLLLGFLCWPFRLALRLQFRFRAFRQPGSAALGCIILVATWTCYQMLLSLLLLPVASYQLPFACVVCCRSWGSPWKASRHNHRRLTEAQASITLLTLALPVADAAATPRGACNICLLHPLPLLSSTERFATCLAAFHNAVGIHSRRFPLLTVLLLLPLLLPTVRAFQYCLSNVIATVRFTL